MADLQEILGHVIRQERQNQSLTMKELGEKAGLSEIYVGEIERGQKYPSAKVLESLARALELDMAALLDLVAEEIRREREPGMTQVIGFTYTPRQTKRRTTVRRMVNMLLQYPQIGSGRENGRLSFPPIPQMGIGYTSEVDAPMKQIPIVYLEDEGETEQEKSDESVLDLMALLRERQLLLM